MAVSGRSHTIRVFALACSFLLLVAAFLLFLRPWYLTWGATASELTRALPGDGIVANAGQQQTRAITIDAPIERVWPWIAQIGQDRAGFYSFDVLENAVGCRMPVEKGLNAANQQWHVGDKLWMYPPDRAGGAGFATLREYVPGRTLGFGTRVIGTPLTAPEDGSWSFILEPVGSSRTRLLIRGRMAPGRSLAGQVFDRLIFEPAHFAMERRMMLGIKQLAEGSNRNRLVNHAHAALWTITFAMFLASGVMVLGRAHWRRPLFAFAAAGVVFQVLTLAQPDFVSGSAMVFAVAAIVFPQVLIPSRLLQP